MSAQLPANVLPPSEQKHEYVQTMFDAIAPRYDLLNSVMSARLHHGWRERAVQAARLEPGQSAIDVCTGTGDLAFALARRVGSAGRVAATDFSPVMLDIARQKASRRDATADSAPVALEAADTLHLPFANNTFDAATVGFGLRNVVDVQKGVDEMARVVKPGGRVVILETGVPRNRALAALYRWASLRVMPFWGGLIGGNRGAYTYLPASVAVWKSRDGLTETLRAAGLIDVQVLDLTLGTVVIHSALKPL